MSGMYPLYMKHCLKNENRLPLASWSHPEETRVNVSVHLHHFKHTDGDTVFAVETFIDGSSNEDTIAFRYDFETALESFHTAVNALALINVDMHSGKLLPFRE